MNPYLEIENDALVAECMAGNQEALGVFYTRFAPKMYSVVTRYVSDADDAKDILHDGFIVALTRLSTLRTPDRVEYWLATIMKNLSLQFLQAQDVDKILHEIPEKADTPEFDEIIDLPTLESLIQKLPEGYQTVFRLAVLENKTHKEIAEILGIAPNSSSSQLFRAKMMMRSLIKEYRHKSGLLILLLITTATGFLWWQHTSTPDKNGDMGQSAIAGTGKDSDTDNFTNDCDNNYPVTNRLPSRKITFAKPVQSTGLPVADNTTGNEENPYTDTFVSNNANEHVTWISESTDTTCEDTYKDSIPTGGLQPDLLAANETYSPGQRSRRSQWSLKIGLNTGSSSTGVLPPVYGDCDNFPPKDPEDEDNQPLRAPGIPDRDYNDIRHFNDIPVTISATVNKSVTKAISLETGLTYTYLHTTFEHNTYSSECRWHYIGIPLKLSYTNLSTRRVKLYATIGAQLDLPVSSRATISDTEASRHLPDGRFGSPAVWSASISYGININLNRHIGIYAEPSLQYHFEHGYTVPNAWADDKWMFSLPVGLRYNF